MSVLLLLLSKVYNARGRIGCRGLAGGGGSRLGENGV